MPIHDWSRVEAGIYHYFHQRWIGIICDALNEDLLPEDYYALGEQWAGGRNEDVLTLRGRGGSGGSSLPEATGRSGTATAIRERPKTTYVVESETEAYLRKKSVVAVRHVSDDRVMALIEIVSPGNKSSKEAFGEFKKKIVDLLRADVNVMLIDLLPRTKRDPRGIHATIWESISAVRATVPKKPPLTLVSYETGDIKRGYFEPVAIGQRLPDMPLFLDFGWHVQVPLEQTYTLAYRKMPLRWRRVIEGKDQQ